MPIIHAKEWALWPLVILEVWSIRRFHYVKYDRHSVFIVSTHYTLMSVDRITSNFSMTSYWTFCCRWIYLRKLLCCWVEGYNDFVARLQRKKIEVIWLLWGILFDRCWSGWRDRLWMVSSKRLITLLVVIIYQLLFQCAYCRSLVVVSCCLRLILSVNALIIFIHR